MPAQEPSAEAWEHERQGLSLLGAGRREDAGLHLRRAAELAPRSALILCNLARYHLDQGDGAAAEGVVARALAAEPDFVPALELQGFLDLSAGRRERAAAQYARVVALAPGALAARHNLALLLRDLGHVADAAAQAEALVASRADAPALDLLASLRSRQNRFLEAVGLLDRAQAADGRDRLGEVARNAYALQHACAWAPRAELRRRVMDRLHGPAPPVLHPFMLLTDEAAAGADVLAANRAIAAAIGRDAVPVTRPPRPAGHRLRLGYLSGDFRNHALMLLAAEMFELHDRSVVETFGYAHGPPDETGHGARARRAMEHWADLGPLDDDAAARRIAADGIDVLVDLTWTGDAGRPGITARRPAPVQVCWPGYPATTGAPWIDALIADAVVAPPEEDALFSERVVRLPVCYLPFDRTRPRPGPPPPRAGLGLPEDSVVFCCMNGSQKITPDVFAIWLRLLADVPGSVLWLLRTNPLALAALRRTAERAGIAPARLIEAPHLPWHDHVTRLGAADLFLDTQPYGAHTSAAEAMWAGLPLVTWHGARLAGRVAASLLHAAGIEETVAADAQGYAALALALARDPARRGAIRRRLLAAGDAGTLFRTGEVARALEAAFLRLSAGQAPRTPA